MYHTTVINFYGRCDYPKSLIFEIYAKVLMYYNYILSSIDFLMDKILALITIMPAWFAVTYKSG